MKCGHAMHMPWCESCRKSEELAAAKAPPRVLTTNHPEIADPAERKRLGLPPLGGLSEAMKEVDRALEPSTMLTGDAHTAYQRFAAAAKAVQAHQTAGEGVMAEYRAALAELSKEAAK